MSEFGGQREIIDSALRRLGLHTDEKGFDRLGQEVGTKGRTLYKAWLGHIKISERVRLALAKTGTPSPEANSEQQGEQMHKCVEQLGFIYQHGSHEQTRMIEAILDSAYQQVAEGLSAKSAMTPS